MSPSARLAMLRILVAIGVVAPSVFSVTRNFQVRPDPGDVLRAVRSP